MINNLAAGVILVCGALYLMSKNAVNEKREQPTVTYKCVDGVSDICDRMSPHFKPDGSLFTCDKG